VVVIFHSSSKSSDRSNVAAPAAPGLSAGNGRLEGRTCAKDNARIKRKVPGKYPARRMPVEKRQMSPVSSSIGHAGGNSLRTCENYPLDFFGQNNDMRRSVTFRPPRERALRDFTDPYRRISATRNVLPNAAGCSARRFNQPTSSQITRGY
jgi:hypothetical protein